MGDGRVVGVGRCCSLGVVGVGRSNQGRCRLKPPYLFSGQNFSALECSALVVVLCSSLHAVLVVGSTTQDS
jgi:hypothetical protein